MLSLPGFCFLKGIGRTIYRDNMLRILLVDDSKSAQLKTLSILSGYGSCDQAYNGRDAIELFENSLASGMGYDLVLMDVVMPGMDGFQTATEILRIQDKLDIPETDKVKIIMLTSRADPAHMMKAQFEVGVATYITKPYEERTLIESIRNLGLIQDAPESW